mmetsp:Transcript_25730/g.64276  ORF Transcript_25730/g.64276 Transcript_25730/m.64276 type:complete len:243 (+) Transcript_25730:61-789(+)
MNLRPTVVLLLVLCASFFCALASRGKATQTPQVCSVIRALSAGIEEHPSEQSELRNRTPKSLTIKNASESEEAMSAESGSAGAEKEAMDVSSGRVEQLDEEPESTSTGNSKKRSLLEISRLAKRKAKISSEFNAEDPITSSGCESKKRSMLELSRLAAQRAQAGRKDVTESPQNQQTKSDVKDQGQRRATKTGFFDKYSKEELRIAAKIFQREFPRDENETQTPPEASIVFRIGSPTLRIET